MLVSLGHYSPPQKKSCCKEEAIFSEFSTQLNQHKTGLVKTNSQLNQRKTGYFKTNNHIFKQYWPWSCKQKSISNYQSSDFAGWVKNTKNHKHNSKCTSHLAIFWEFSTQFNQRKTGCAKTNSPFVFSICITSHNHIFEQTTLTLILQTN